jgi:hypothetical protein
MLPTVMPNIFENADADLTPQMRNLIDLLWREWKMVEQIEVLSLELGGSLFGRQLRRIRLACATNWFMVLSGRVVCKKDTKVVATDTGSHRDYLR